MDIDKKVYCFQGEIRIISGPLDNGTKMEIRIDLGTRLDQTIGELRFRIPVADRRLYRVGDRYAVSASPVE